MRTRAFPALKSDKAVLYTAEEVFIRPIIGWHEFYSGLTEPVFAFSDALQLKQPHFSLIIRADYVTACTLAGYPETLPVEPSFVEGMKPTDLNLEFGRLKSHLVGRSTTHSTANIVQSFIRRLDTALGGVK